MSSILLDFEKPLEELHEQLTKAKQIQEKGKVNVNTVIKELESKIEKTRKDLYSNLSAWQRVQLSRHPERPYTLDYINAITEGNFLELYGDRQVKDDKAMIGGFGSVDGQTIMFVGQQKGNNTKARQYRNFGMPNPEGYRSVCRRARFFYDLRPAHNFLQPERVQFGQRTVRQDGHAELGHGRMERRRLYDCGQFVV